MKHYKSNIHKQDDSVDTEGSWAISYGDMITLLMAFFVMFYTFEKGHSKYKGMTEAVMQVLSGQAVVKGGAGSADKGQKKAAGLLDQGDKKGAGITDKQEQRGLAGLTDENEEQLGIGREKGEGISKTAKPIAHLAGIQGGTSVKDGVGEGKMIGKGKEQEEGQGKGVGEGPEFGERAEGGFEAKVHRLKENLLVEFPRISFYRSGEITLTKEGREVLSNFGRKFVPYAGSYFIGVRAFTDIRPVIQGKRHRFSDNLELSALRAVAAMRVLQEAGIPLSRMKLGGYGELLMTAKDLAKFPEYAEQEKSLSLARRVILVISPEEAI